MLSTSSKKMRQAFFVRAIWNISRTIRAPSPTYFCTSSDPTTLMKHASVRLAHARADSVLPVPGGPYLRCNSDKRCAGGWEYGSQENAFGRVDAQASKALGMQ